MTESEIRRICREEISRALGCAKAAAEVPVHESAPDKSLAGCRRAVSKDAAPYVIPRAWMDTVPTECDNPETAYNLGWAEAAAGYSMESPYGNEELGQAYEDGYRAGKLVFSGTDLEVDPTEQYHAAVRSGRLVPRK